MKLLHILCIIFLCLFFSCKNDVNKINAITGIDYKKLPSESIYNTQILYSDSAKINLKVNATQINRYAGEKPYFEMPKGFQVFFYEKYPKVETQLKADYAIGFENNNGIEKMDVKRNVSVVNKKGEILNAEQLTWDAKKKRIYTNKFVKITTKDQIIWGNGIDADEEFSDYEIKEVKGIVNINDFN